MKHAIEEIRCGVVCGDPVRVQQKIVSFIGEDERLHVHVASAEILGELDGL